MRSAGLWLDLPLPDRGFNPRPFCASTQPHEAEILTGLSLLHFFEGVTAKRGQPGPTARLCDSKGMRSGQLTSSRRGKLLESIASIGEQATNPRSGPRSLLNVQETIGGSRQGENVGCCTNELQTVYV